MIRRESHQAPPNFLVEATSMRHELPLLYLEDLSVGDEWRSPGRTITEADIVAFAGISGDFNPLHVDHEFARTTPFRGPIAHGLLGLAVASGLASQAPRIATLAFLEIVDWKFHHPIAPGDTIHTLTRVESIEPRARGRRGLVTWLRRIVNQADRTVQEGHTKTMVRGRPRPLSDGAAEADDD